MSRLDHVANVLQELAAEAGLDRLALDATDRASLRFDGITVTFTYAAEPVELLWLHADLGPVPTDGDAAPAWLLRLGLMTWASSRMTIGLDQSGTRAVGATAVAVVMLDLATLKEVLARLLEAARPIRDGLAEHQFDLDPSVAASAGAPPAADLRA